jgi:electron transport complex protein RnfG
MIVKAISKNSLLLGLFAVITTAGIAGTYLSTKDAIKEQKRAAEAEALLEIIPPSRHNNSMLDDTIMTSDQTYLHLSEPKPIYIAKQNDSIVGFIFPAIAPEGYTDKIELIVGVNTDGSVAGVRVLSHRETPGLGDKVDLKKSPWVLDFNNKSLFSPKPELWKVKKDKGVFDQFTGATITPRAVTKAVFNVLQYYAAHRSELLPEKQQPLDSTNTSKRQAGNQGLIHD